PAGAHERREHVIGTAGSTRVASTSGLSSAKSRVSWLSSTVWIRVVGTPAAVFSMGSRRRPCSLPLPATVHATPGGGGT
ncbi:hypothetical protein GBAR_LOCUS527, partial [Geodia barretti]